MEGKSITVKGKNLSYVEKGSGSPIVLVHGNTGSKLWWRDVMDIPGHRLIALDMPNFGSSDAIDVADIDVYADYVGAFIVALKLASPMLVGHSLGGAVVMSLAARNPAIAKSLVIIDGASPAGLVTPEASYPYIEMFKTNRPMMRQALAAVAPTLQDDATLDGLTDDAMRMAPLAFAGNARALERFNYEGRAGDFKGPVLVIWGRKDGIITEAMARETAAAYKGSRLEILEDVGHSVMVEDPARFKRLILDFAAKHP
ncbi:MAG: alpha/beta fold hydrolase [Spirochaetia bacterium]|jgi:branched-chain amino acid transport system permease protein|nr:alpha/beta fold hydrolase [Spirochaetia bacterium]